MATVVRMPEVLANTTEAAIQNWLVHAGQAVTVGEPIAEVETEKAVVEYAAETAGTVLRLLVSEGQTVAVGDPIAVIGDAAELTDAEPAGDPSPSDERTAPTSAAPEPETAPDRDASPVSGAPTELGPEGRAAAESRPEQRRFASPIVRRLARERGLDLSTVHGSGPDGRIVRRDLDRIVREDPAPTSPPAIEVPADAAPPEAPRVVAPTGAGRDVVVTGMRRAIARRLTESKTTVPHFYMSADCRVDSLLELRRQVNAVTGTKTSVNDFVVKAAAGAFVEVPEANATWGDGVIHHFEAVDIAIAVAVDAGLLTPVLRGVDQLNLTAVSRQAADLIARARAGRLRQHELEGGSASISNLGMYGIKEFSAIINPPQSAILAVGAAQQRPVVTDGELAVATVMTVTLSADHRVIDGAVAARWMAAFVGFIEEPLRILL